ncbi:MAG TPA: pilus assembly protein N-terminal domain-containing protein [Burkholderiaceae bacterium]|jgi:pilus assembly protein CpaC|nr:pilus assembly protein N-terminal domain-containing protein [Burkholderiaceae bacterium]
MNTKRPWMLAALMVSALWLWRPASAAQDADAPVATQPADRSTVALSTRDPVPPTRPFDARPSAQPSVLLYTGQVQVLDMPNVSRVAVGNGSVLKAQVIDSGQVVLIGQAAGSTTLRLWASRGAQYAYEVTVRSNDTVRAARDIQDMLVNEPGLRVTPYDGHVLIEGDYSNPATSRKLDAIAQMFPQGVVSLVPDHRVQPPVPLEKMVYLDVRVVEVRKNALEQLGIQWGSPVAGPELTLNGTVVPSAPQSWKAVFGIATDLTSMLNILESNGDSWTLAEPRVSCKSGGDAKFLVGGEIPIPVASALGQTTIVYKEYGVILEFHPVADDEGNISSKVVAEVSQPDQQFTNQGFVAFRQNRTETQVSLRENETLVISGLLQNSGSKTITGIPGVSEIPILGALFRSKNFQNERTELIVMVTPRPATPQSETNVAMMRRSDERYNTFNRLIDKNMAE